MARKLLSYSTAQLRKKIEANNMYDEWDLFDDARLKFCCGIIEIGNFAQGELPYDLEIAYSVKRAMDCDRSNTAIATTTNKMPEENKILPAIGFTKVSTSKNPKTGNLVYLWVYSRKG